MFPSTEADTLFFPHWSTLAWKVELEGRVRITHFLFMIVVNFPLHKCHQEEASGSMYWVYVVSRLSLCHLPAFPDNWSHWETNPRKYYEPARHQRAVERKTSALKLSICHFSFEQRRKNLVLWTFLWRIIFRPTCVAGRTPHTSLRFQVTYNIKHQWLPVGLGLSQIHCVHDDLLVGMTELYFCK